MVILVTGCTGFVGSHLVNALVEQGFGVKCLARGGKGLEHLPAERITFVTGDVTKPDSLAPAMEGVDTIIHLVGIIREKGDATFERVHVEGTRNVLQAARSRGIHRFIYQSALGAREDGITGYQRTKWQAEELVRKSGLEWIITRPSIIIGKWGDFVQILVDLVKKPPVIPVIGSGEYKLQPLYVGDLAQAFIKMLGPAAAGTSEIRNSKSEINPKPEKPETPNSESEIRNPQSAIPWNRVYEFGGPEQLAFNQMLEITKEVLGVRKPMVHLPVALMKPVIRAMESVLPNAPVTSDELAMMAEDNVTDHNAFTEVFGIEPTAFREALGLSI
jgi:NADH dehydrogenase